MTAPRYALFDTAIGRCGIAWGPGGIERVWLPESRDDGTRARWLGHHPEARETAPPPQIRRAISAIHHDAERGGPAVANPSRGVAAGCSGSRARES